MLPKVHDPSIEWTLYVGITMPKALFFEKSLISKKVLVKMKELEKVF